MHIILSSVLFSRKPMNYSLKAVLDLFFKYRVTVKVSYWLLFSLLMTKYSQQLSHGADFICNWGINTSFVSTIGSHLALCFPTWKSVGSAHIYCWYSLVPVLLSHQQILRGYLVFPSCSSIRKLKNLKPPITSQFSSIYFKLSYPNFTLP